MSRNISEIAANRRRVRPGQRYGLEVEAEGCPLDTVGDMRWSAAYHAYWSPTEDGSLRNGGIEFVSRPLTVRSVLPAINALWPYFAEGRMVPSVRTGIHIHVSCLGLTTDDVRRILRHYVLLEPVLFDFVGPEREENIYCIPWYRAPEEASIAHQWMKAWEDPRTRTEEPCKYGAVYVHPLSTFGTIEFRHAPTWTDSRTMHRWWQMVQAIWATHRTEYDVQERYAQIGPRDFAASILPFDWLHIPNEHVFEEADVDVVCSLIGDSPVVERGDWGAPPELRTPRNPPPARRSVLQAPETIWLAQGMHLRTANVDAQIALNALADLEHQEQEMMNENIDDAFEERDEP